eukprot:scaffold162668_cov67-Attheya_sp.AAC.1
MAVKLALLHHTKKEQKETARPYEESHAGRIPNKAGSTLWEATYHNITDIFNAIDTDMPGFLDPMEVSEVATTLELSLITQELDHVFSQMDKSNNSRVDFEEF